MSTIPNYDPASTPLGDDDQLYIEQGPGADRGKRVTIQVIRDKMALGLGAMIAAQPTDPDGVVAAGDFLAAENAGVGKKFPVSALEPAPAVYRPPTTGAKSFRLLDSTGVGSLVDNQIIVGDNHPTGIVFEGNGRIELFLVFKFNPTAIVSSSRQVAFVMSDATDSTAAVLAGLVSTATPLQEYFPASCALHNGLFAHTARMSASTSSMTIRLHRADGTDLLYSDVYNGSVTESIIQIHARIFR